MRAFRVSAMDEVMGARQFAGALSREVGFSDEDTGRVALVVTELGTNLIKHAGGGELVIGTSATSERPCLDILALDHGSGLGGEAQFEDGYSTAGTQGTGLGAIRRQSSTFDYWSAPGLGTAIHSRVCGQEGYKPRHQTPWAGIARIVAGEEVCGDVLAVREEEGQFLVLVADGLGHGPLAAEAANIAADKFYASSARGAEDLVEAIHNALRATRGAAIAVTEMDLRRGVATYCGVGNIAGSVQTAGAVKKMTSLNGTAGLVARKVQGFQYPFGAEALLVMHSDGLSASWNLEKYPALLHRDPMLIAAVLYRDFARTRDDASVVVARMAA